MTSWHARLGEKRRGGVLETYILDVHSPDGHRQRTSLRTTDPAQAAEMLDAWKRNPLPSLERSAAAEPEGNTRLAAVLDYYTQTYLPVKGASPKSVTEAGRVLREFELRATILIKAP